MFLLSVFWSVKLKSDSISACWRGPQTIHIQQREKTWMICLRNCYQYFWHMDFILVLTGVGTSFFKIQWLIHASFSKCSVFYYFFLAKSIINVLWLMKNAILEFQLWLFKILLHRAIMYSWRKRNNPHRDKIFLKNSNYAITSSIQIVYYYHQ